jgi:multidrug efflux pump subunit AcrB
VQNKLQVATPLLPQEVQQQGITEAIQTCHVLLNHLRHAILQRGGIGTRIAHADLYCRLSFKNGTDPDIAQVQVQNKLQVATPLLPQEVQQQGQYG